jgi:predicted CopG family antitoxin
MSKLIKVSDDTHAELVKIGAKAETFDHVIQRLIKILSSQSPEDGAVDT